MSCVPPCLVAATLRVDADPWKGDTTGRRSTRCGFVPLRSTPSVLMGTCATRHFPSFARPFNGSSSRSPDSPRARSSRSKSGSKPPPGVTTCQSCCTVFWLHAFNFCSIHIAHAHNATRRNAAQRNVDRAKGSRILGNTRVPSFARKATRRLHLDGAPRQQRGKLTAEPFPRPCIGHQLGVQPAKANM